MIRKTLLWASALLMLCVVASMAVTLSFRWINPPGSAFMVWHTLSTGLRADQRWTPLSRISPTLHIAVIAAEDQKFPLHFGFDFQSIAETVEQQQRRGASTITQQTAKNLFLWSGRSYLRKGIEAWFALLMELFLPKQRILEIYLNIAEFGPGIYGAESASRRFYGKSAAHLTAYEAAILAAVLPNPKRMSAARPSRYVRGRALEILDIIDSLGGVEYLAVL